MLKALKTMLKDDIINPNTWRIKCMGTQQALTTEQLELLIILQELALYSDDKIGELTAVTEKFELISWDSIGREIEDVDRDITVLQYYDYIDKNMEITIDGEQYIKLAKAYVEEKKRHRFAFICVENFSLLNVEKLGIIFEMTTDWGKCFETIVDGAGKVVIKMHNWLKSKHK